MNSDQVNEALSKYLQLPWISNEDKTLMFKEYGESIVSTINEMCEFAANSHVWSKADYTVAIKETKVRLMKSYPFLSNNSIEKITNIAAYYWK